MTVIHGVVRNGVVVLPRGADLPEGVEVEVRVLGDPGEDAFQRHLLETGLVTKLPTRSLSDGKRPRPAKVEGRPLSEQIIEERR